MTLSDQLHNDFHSHLDGCERCRNNPFDLCEQGRTIMRKIREIVEGKRCEHGLMLYGAKCLSCEKGSNHGEQ